MARLNARTIKCSGTLYASRSLIIHRPASADFYENASAICDTCGERVTLTGRRLPSHYLTVTIHGVSL